MSILKTKGIVISESNYNDYDKMLTILTPGQGKISAIAKGARRTSSKILAGTQLFSFCDFVLFKSKELYHVNEAETIEIFYNLRTDLDRLNCAIDLNKIVLSVTYEDQNQYKILMLYVKTLDVIARCKDIYKLEFIKNVFKLKLSKYLGFMPNYNYCYNCKQTDASKLVYFSIVNSSVVCSKCKTNIDKKINGSVYMAIKYVIETPIEKLYNFSLKQDSEIIFNKLISLYFQEKIYNIN